LNLLRLLQLNVAVIDFKKIVSGVFYRHMEQHVGLRRDTVQLLYSFAVVDRDLSRNIVEKSQVDTRH
jgi:hypothetical protein